MKDGRDGRVGWVGIQVGVMGGGIVMGLMGFYIEDIEKL